MRHKQDVHRQLLTSVYKKGVYYFGIKLYTKLSLKIKCLSNNSRQFKIAQKEFLLTHTFYSVDEFILRQND